MTRWGRNHAPRSGAIGPEWGRQRRADAAGPSAERGFEALLPRPLKRPRMEIERKTMVEIAVSVGAVLVFVAAMVGIGITYGAGRVLSSQGGVALLVAMAAFVLLMTGIGYFLARWNN